MTKRSLNLCFYEIRRDIIKGINFYVNPIPDEVAEEHLSKYPSEVNKFAHLPTDWEDRVAAYKARKLAQTKKKAEEANNEVPTTSAEDAEKSKPSKHSSPKRRRL